MRSSGRTERRPRSTAPDLAHAIERGAGQLQPGRRFEFAINRELIGDQQIVHAWIGTDCQFAALQRLRLFPEGLLPC